MVIQTATPGLQLRIEKDGRAGEAHIYVEQRTPAGFEEVGCETVGLPILREVLTEWYDVPKANLRGV